MISSVELAELKRQAHQAEKLERIWIRKYRAYFDDITQRVTQDLLSHGRIDESLVDFEDLMMFQWYMVNREALSGATHMYRLAGLPKGKAPRTIFEIMDAWKKWRKKGKAMPRQKAIAKKLKEEYLKRIKTVWKKYSEPFRTGNESDQKKAIDAIKTATQKSYGKSKTIATTETTRYYNEARRSYYDQSEDVTHYLFLAIRDHRTTKWCSTRTGLVYEKDSAYLERETPPCHWNCRSEITPLTPLNPAHKVLIDKASLQRKNRHPEPLPIGWNK